MYLMFEQYHLNVNNLLLTLKKNYYCIFFRTDPAIPYVLL
jgi:hypothetical protein